MKMQEEMAKFQGAGQLFTTPAMGTQAGGATYTYGPNGELVPKDKWGIYGRKKKVGWSKIITLYWRNAVRILTCWCKSSRDFISNTLLAEVGLDSVFLNLYTYLVTTHFDRKKFVIVMHNLDSYRSSLETKFRVWSCRNILKSGRKLIQHYGKSFGC